MNLARRHRRLTAWIALFAMLAFGLVPTLSRAMSSLDGGSAWSEVCTPRGVKVVAADDDQAALPQATGHALDHCTFCGLASDGAAPWPSPPLALPPALACSEAPGAGQQAAHTRLAWRCAPARAPPARH